jgi:class 3 adenylate cyclase/tetratricopeptide (TPR) repeat protein
MLKNWTASVAMTETNDMSLTSDKSHSVDTSDERKIISILFTDVVGYTSLAEKLDMEVLREIMNHHFQLLIDSVNKFEGTVDQLLGDGMIAFFGAPRAYEDHAQRACYAALAVQKAMKQFSETIHKNYGIEFLVRIGINSGLVLVGPVGTDQHTEYIATGDTVNLASRMENASRPGGILVSQNTYLLVKDFFQFETIGEIGIKGKEKPVMAYRLFQAVKTERRFEAAVLKGLTRFIGRENELEILHEAFKKAKNTNSQIVSITGEPGIGKSRLLRGFKESLKSENLTYLEGYCLHYGNLMPYRPLVDILKAYFDIQEDDPEPEIKVKMAKKLGQMDESLLSYLPFLYEMLSLKVEDERFQRMENQYKRRKLFEGITSLLLKEATERSLIITIEDLHWMDKASEDFLTYLINRLPESKILLILLYRPEYKPPWTSRQDYYKVHLEQLSISSSSELLKALLANGEPDSILQKTVLAKTGGNPLFVEEFVHSLVDNSSVRKEGEQYTLNIMDSTIKLPDTLQGIIAARVDRLPEGLKNTLQVAAVIGRDFNYPVLQDVTQLPKELKNQLEILQQLEFIVAKEDSPEIECVFKHALIQEVVYDSLLQKIRKELHESIAQSVERLYPERSDELVEVLAYHYERSNSKDKAVEYLRKSGRKARNRYTIEESHHYYQQAFELIKNKTNKNSEEESELLDIILEWSEVYYYRGHFRSLMELLESHQDLPVSLGDKSRQAMLLGWLGISYYAVGRIRESYQCLHQALTLAEETGDQKAIAYAGAWIVWTCEVLGLADEGFAYAETSITACSQFEGDDYPYIKALGGKGFFLATIGKNREALECANKLVEFGNNHGNLRSLALGYCTAAFCHWNNGDSNSALNDCQQGLKLAVDPFYYEVLKLAFGYINIFSGNFQEGEAALQEVVLHSRQYGIEKLGWTASALLGAIMISKGQMAKGFHMIEEVNRHFIKNDVRRDHATNEYLLGMLYSQMTAPAGPIKIPVLLKNLVFIVRQAPFAFQRATEHYNTAAKMCREYSFGGMLGMVYLGLGQLYLQKGKKELARENLLAAATLCRKCEATANLKQAEELLSNLEKRK